MVNGAGGPLGNGAVTPRGRSPERPKVPYLDRYIRPESQDWLASDLAEDLGGVSPMTKNVSSEGSAEPQGRASHPLGYVPDWAGAKYSVSTIISTDEEFSVCTRFAPRFAHVGADLSFPTCR